MVLLTNFAEVIMFIISGFVLIFCGNFHGISLERRDFSPLFFVDENELRNKRTVSTVTIKSSKQPIRRTFDRKQRVSRQDARRIIITTLIHLESLG